jgi:hypothetical protein
MIKNLQLQLNEAGKIKIGTKGEEQISSKGKNIRLPQKLDYILLTTTEKDKNGNYIHDTALMDRIKENKTGLVNEQGNLVGIPIRLLYDEVELNFPTRYACYAGKHLSCYGDGEVAHKRLDDYKKEHPCPCGRLDPNYDGQNRCKPNGRLVCMIDEAGLFGQAHTFRTTGINSVRGIWGGIELIKVATKGRIAGLPLMLTLTAKHTEKGIVYIVSVCFRGTMEDLRDSVRELAMKEKDYLLTMPQKDDGLVISPGSEEEKDFVEEFYPDSTEEADQDNKAEFKTELEPVKQEEKQRAGQEKNQSPEQDSKDLQPEKELPEKELPEKELPKNKPIINLDGRLLEEKTQYAKLYNRFMVALAEDDRTEAFKLAKRITKDYLAIWFEKEHPEITFPGPGVPKKLDYLDRIKLLLEGDFVLFENAPVIEGKKTEQHPFLAEITAMTEQKQVADVMTKFFNPIPINRTLDIPELIALAESMIGTKETSVKTKEEPKNKGGETENIQEETSPQTESNQDTDNQEVEDPKSIEDFRKFDTESGKIQDEQLVIIVKLKTKLESIGKLRPENWLNHVMFFLDQNGEPFDSATKFSFNQGNAFISMLNKPLPEADRIEPIPF